MNRLGRRTNTDFSKHVHESTVLEKDGIKIQVDTFHVKDTCIGFMQFVNTPNGLVVYGDYGNWMFCRTFYPNSKEFKISDDYWLEKLQINSNQIFEKLDCKLNTECLNDLLKEFRDVDNYNLSEEELEGAEEWVEGLKADLENGDTIGYLYNAFREYPSCLDTEDIPCHKEVPVQLRVVFDAFEEMCLRLKESEVVNE